MNGIHFYDFLIGFWIFTLGAYVGYMVCEHYARKAIKEAVGFRLMKPPVFTYSEVKTFAPPEMPEDKPFDEPATLSSWGELKLYPRWRGDDDD